MFRFERGLRPRNRFLGEASEGAAEAPSDRPPQMGPYHRSQAPSTSSILCPGWSVTTAFFQLGRRPSNRPMRFHLPPRDCVLTEATFTLKTFSTAWRISTLLASRATSKVTVFSSSLRRMLFSVISGRTSTVRGSFIGAFSPLASPRSRLRLLGRGSARTTGQRVLQAEQRGLLEDHPVVPEQLVHGGVGRGLDLEPRDIAGGPGEDRIERDHDEERRLRFDPELLEATRQRLGPGLAEAEALHHRHPARGDLRGERLAQRRAPHLGRHALVVTPRGGTEGPAAPLRLGSAA